MSKPTTRVQLLDQIEQLQQQVLDAEAVIDSAADVFGDIAGECMKLVAEGKEVPNGRKAAAWELEVIEYCVQYPKGVKNA